MDSFIGAVDLLSKHEDITLVSHHKSGGTAERSTQDELIKILKEEFPGKTIRPFSFYVQPKQSETGFGGEDTQRARSILFLMLGLLIANSTVGQCPLTIPENGLISLNVPLTHTRLGSFSTKTTHPNFLYKLHYLLSKLGIFNELENPYKFQTKGGNDPLF